MLIDFSNKLSYFVLILFLGNPQEEDSALKIELGIVFEQHSSCPQILRATM